MISRPVRINWAPVNCRSDTIMVDCEHDSVLLFWRKGRLPRKYVQRHETAPVLLATFSHYVRWALPLEEDVATLGGKRTTPYLSESVHDSQGAIRKDLSCSRSAGVWVPRKHHFVASFSHSWHIAIDKLAHRSD